MQEFDRAKPEPCDGEFDVAVVDPYLSEAEAIFTTPEKRVLDPAQASPAP